MVQELVLVQGQEHLDPTHGFSYAVTAWAIYHADADFVEPSWQAAMHALRLYCTADRLVAQQCLMHSQKLS